MKIKSVELPLYAFYCGTEASVVKTEMFSQDPFRFFRRENFILPI